MSATHDEDKSRKSKARIFPRAIHNYAPTRLHKMAFDAIEKYGSSTAALEPFIESIIASGAEAVGELMGWDAVRAAAHGLLQNASATRKSGFKPPDVELVDGVTKSGLAALIMASGRPSSYQLSIQRKVKAEQDATLLSFFERTRVPDGRLLSKVRFGELDGLARTSRIWDMCFRMVKSHGGAADSSAFLPEVVSDAQMQEFYRRAEEIANVQ